MVGYNNQVIKALLLSLRLLPFIFPCVSDYKRYKIIRKMIFLNFKEAFMVFSHF